MESYLHLGKFLRKYCAKEPTYRVHCVLFNRKSPMLLGRELCAFSHQSIRQLVFSPMINIFITSDKSLSHQ